jgi:hypothetical protein
MSQYATMLTTIRCKNMNMNMGQRYKKVTSKGWRLFLFLVRTEEGPRSSLLPKSPARPSGVQLPMGQSGKSNCDRPVELPLSTKNLHFHCCSSNSPPPPYLHHCHICIHKVFRTLQAKGSKHQTQTIALLTPSKSAYLPSSSLSWLDRP